MLMSMSILNDTVKLLTNINNGTNTLVINNSIVPESSWVGTGYYTVGNIRIAKISANSGNIHLIKVNDLNYKLVVKTNTSVIWAKNVSYDNTVSGSTEDDVQGAIDDLYDKLDDMHPVGSIYLSVTDTNPATYFGGTWVRISKGRVLVGVDENDTAFDTAEETGGSKTANLNHSHTLSSHTHTHSHTHGLNGHTHTLSSSGYAKVSFSTTDLQTSYVSTAAWAPNDSFRLPYALTHLTGSNRTDGIQLAGKTDGSSTSTAAASTSTTSKPDKDYTDSKLSSTQSLLQPYLAVYIWKRTA